MKIKIYGSIPATLVEAAMKHIEKADMIDYEWDGERTSYWIGLRDDYIDKSSGANIIHEYSTRRAIMALKRIIRKKLLTPPQAKKYQRTRKQVSKEFPPAKRKI